MAQDASPYVLMNFTDRMDDVMTLAHELGHGMHFTLAAERQTALSMGTGLALAEVPSTFAELLAFDHLLENETDPVTRRALISERVEGSFATVFRQTVLTRYEQRAYALRGEGGTLTAGPALGHLVRGEREVLRRLASGCPRATGWGGPTSPTSSTRASTPTRTSSRTWRRWRSTRATARSAPEFVDGYIGFLSAGGSKTPTELLGALGVDLEDPAVWEPGFREMERMVEAAEAG